MVAECVVPIGSGASFQRVVAFKRLLGSQSAGHTECRESIGSFRGPPDEAIHGFLVGVGLEGTGHQGQEAACSADGGGIEFHEIVSELQ
jgi:hypothetical protein